MDTIKEFEAVHRTRYHFDANPESYQHIIDLSEVNVALIKKTLTYIISIPVLKKKEYIITHVIPIPQRIQNTHISLIPEHEYFFTSKTAYVSTDRKTLKKCKSLAEYKICNLNKPNYKLADTNDCDASIKKRHQVSATCNFSPFRLNSESYIPSKSGYILLPNNKLTLYFLCADSTTSIEVDKNVLFQGSECKIVSDNVQLYLEKTTIYGKSIVLNKTYETPYDRHSLNTLEKHLITLPRQLDLNVLMQTRLSLDDTENLLGEIASHHRVHTWKGKATEWLQYIGYISIGLIGIFTLYKCGVLDIIKKCIPKNLCLISVKT